MIHVQRRFYILAAMLVIAVGAATVGGRPAIAQGGFGDGTSPELEGTWRTTVALYGMPGGDPPPLDGVLHSFSRGGVLLITLPLPGQSAAQGVWVRVGPRRFGFTVEMFWHDPATGQMGKTKVKEVIEVSANGDEYRSIESSAVDIYPDGRTVPYCARTYGKRMKVEAPDRCR